MANLRELLNKKPWLGWSVAGAAMCVAVYFAWRSNNVKGEYTTERMTQTLTIRFTDTGDTMEIARGRLMRDLMLAGGHIDPSKGIINPKTNQPTGFPFDKADWETMVAQINRDSAKTKGRTAATGSPPSATSAAGVSAPVAGAEAPKPK